jgi:hypothetical protein
VTSSRNTEEPSVADWAAFGDGPAPGDRAPDVHYRERDGDDGGGPRLHDLFRGTGHVLLLFDGAAATDRGYKNLDGIAREVKDKYGHLVDVHVVVPRGERPAALTWTGAVLLDARGAIHKTYGARSECLYLIRPDGYVAYRTQPADGARLGEYLRSIFVRA